MVFSELILSIPPTLLFIYFITNNNTPKLTYKEQKLLRKSYNDTWGTRYFKYLEWSKMNGFRYYPIPDSRVKESNGWLFRWKYFWRY